MTTKTQNKDVDLLDEIAKITDDFGVKSCKIYPSSQLAEIIYKELGHGSVLSQEISDMMNELAPNRTYRIKMIPTDRKLVVEL